MSPAWGWQPLGIPGQEMQGSLLRGAGGEGKDWFQGQKGFFWAEEGSFPPWWHREQGSKAQGPGQRSTGLAGQWSLSGGSGKVPSSACAELACSDCSFFPHPFCLVSSPLKYREPGLAPCSLPTDAFYNFPCKWIYWFVYINLSPTRRGRIGGWKRMVWAPPVSFLWLA